MLASQIIKFLSDIAVDPTNQIQPFRAPIYTDNVNYPIIALAIGGICCVLTIAIAASIIVITKIKKK
jgi:hypothetical protein